MTSIPSTGSTAGSSAATAANDPNSALAKLGVNDFLKMMIAELQNQDPLNPMQSDQMLQQLSVMTQITSSNKLNTTLDSVELGQNLSNAASFIGKKVSGLSDAATQITGVVDSVSIVQGAPALHIGKDTMALTNVAQILSASAPAAASTATATTTDGNSNPATDPTAAAGGN